MNDHVASVQASPPLHHKLGVRDQFEQVCHEELGARSLGHAGFSDLLRETLGSPAAVQIVIPMFCLKLTFHTPICSLTDMHEVAASDLWAYRIDTVSSGAPACAGRLECSDALDMHIS